MEENKILIKGGIMINVNVSLENVMYVKKIMVRILLHVVAKIFNKYYR